MNEITWFQRLDDMVFTWCERAEKQSREHVVTADTYMYMHKFCGVSNICVNILCMGCSQDMSWIGFLLVGLLSGVCAFVNFAEVSKSHAKCSRDFDELIVLIQVEMCKPTRSRREYCVFLERIEIQLLGVYRESSKT